MPALTPTQASGLVGDAIAEAGTYIRETTYNPRLVSVGVMVQVIGEMISAQSGIIGLFEPDPLTDKRHMTEAELAGLAGGMAAGIAVTAFGGGALGTAGLFVTAGLGLMGGVGLGGALVTGGVVIGATWLVSELAQWAIRESIEFLEKHPEYCPLVLDLDGDGIELIGVDQSTVFFDIDNDGFSERTGWVGPDDGLLAFDSNSDGLITAQSELFGGSAGGFAELAGYDTNSDGLISASDALFGSLLIWRDANQNGVSEASELLTLAAAGLTSISLTSVSDGTNVAGNTIARVGNYTTASNETRTVADALFAVDQVSSVRNDVSGVTLDPAVALIPALQGYGTISDFRIACSEDATLLALAQELVDDRQTFDDFAEFRDAFESVMMRWFGVDDAVQDNRTPYLDTRHLAGVEAIGDFSYEAGTGLPPSVLGARDIEATWDALVDSFAMRFLVQLAHYDQIADVVTQMSALVEAMLADPDMPQATIEAGVVSAMNAYVLDPIQSDLLQQFRPVWYQQGVDRLDVSEAGNIVTDLYDQGMALLNSPLSSGETSTERGEALETVWRMFFALTDAAAPGSELGGLRATATAIFGHSFFYPHENFADASSGTALGTYYADILTGTNGDDVLGGFEDEDILIGGSGNDILRGGVNGDRYVFDANSGDDVIEDSDIYGFNNDVAVFLALDHDDVSFTRSISGSDLVITATDGSGSRVTVSNQFYSAAWTIDSFAFGDGVTVTAAEVRAMLVQGTAASETIIGFEQADIIEGRGGNDTLLGGRGDDTYIYREGDGFDVVSDVGVNSIDTVRFENVASTAVTFHRGTDLDDLVVQMADGSTVTIDGQFESTSWYQIEAFQFSDRVMGPGDIREVLLQATAGNDTIRGFGTDDTLAGLAGDDLLIGGRGDDTYVYYTGDGHDTVADGGINSTDTVLFEGYNFADATFSKVVGAPSDLLVTLSDGGTFRVSQQFDSLGWERVEVFHFDDETLSHSDVLDIILGAEARSMSASVMNSWDEDALVSRDQDFAAWTGNLARTLPDGSFDFAIPHPHDPIGSQYWL